MAMVLALGALLAVVGNAPALAAAPVNDVASHASIITGSGGVAQLDTTAATTEAADPAPTCSTAGPAAATVWFALRPLAHVRITVSATGAARAATTSMYAGMPLLGTELACARRQAGAYPTLATGHANPAGTIDMVLRPGINYYLMVGTEAAGDSIFLSVVVRASSWRAVDPLPARRQGVGVAADSRFLYAFGGLQTSYVPGAQSGFDSAVVNRLDPATGRWATISEMPAGLSYTSPARIGNRIFIPGGMAWRQQSGARCAESTHRVFNTATRRWTTAPAWEGVATYGYASAADPAAGIYYVAGGSYDPTPCDGPGYDSNNDERATQAVRRYNPGSRTWTTLPPMYNARHGAVAQVVSGWLFVAGGLQGTTPLASVEAYNPARQAWYRAANLPVPVYGAAGGLGYTKLGYPQIYVAGGWTAAGETGVTQVYDVLTNTWTVRTGAGSRTTARDAIGSAVLWGRLYAIGGVQRQPVRSSEYLRVDWLPPTASARVNVGVLAVTLAAVASDASGVARVRWRFGDGVVLSGQTVRRRFATPGSRTARLMVWDRAGNVRTRYVRFSVR